MILGVNVDHIATLRQARMANEPDPVIAAGLAVLGGADGITVHLREDRRHIQDRDVRILRETIACELNLEMAATDEMVRIALEIRPDLVTLVPEKRMELTTEGGLDVKGIGKQLREAIAKMHHAGIPVSLFINPENEDVSASKKLGADMVEIHTGNYANSCQRTMNDELRRVISAVNRARELDLYANAGHGLNYQNVSAIAEIGAIRGLYIGHSIIARATLTGLEEAVREMKKLITLKA
jgi:pyridoxine 5-phosphate synthase